jgi:hypothetical protein
MQNLMNLTNAMKSLKVSPNSPIENDQQNQQKNVKTQQNLKKSFIHSSDVIVINSTEYKGQIAFINEFFPGKYQVTIKEFFDKNLVNVKVGTKIPTPNGLATVESIEPEIYKIDNVPVTSFDKFVVYKNLTTKPFVIRDPQFPLRNNGNIFTLARVISFENTNFTVSDTDISSDNLSLEYIKSKLPINKFSDESIIQIDQITETFYSGIGENGFVFGKLQVFPQNVKLSLLKNILLTHKQIEKIDKTHLKITKGPFASSTIHPFVFMEPHLTITLHSTGRRIYHHNVRHPTNNQIISRPIYPKDVFYMDLKLQNGNYAEVVGLDNNNSIVIKEKVNGSFVNNTISFNDISDYLSGFKWTETQIEPEAPKFDDNFIDDNVIVDDSIDNVSDNGDDGASETSEHLMEDTFVPDLDQEMKGSYKDQERITFSQEELTDIQKKFNKIINDILLQFKLQLDSFDILPIIHEIELCLSEIDKMSMLENIDQDIFFSGYRFILASIVFHKIKNIKNINMFTFTQNVLPVLFGKSSKSIDIINNNNHIFTLYTRLSYFGHLKTMRQIKAWINNKKTDQMSVITEMMTISYQLAKKILGFTEVTNTFTQEFIGLGQGSYDSLKNYIPYDKYNDPNTKKFITLNDILKNGLPKQEYKIIYNPGVFNTVQSNLSSHLNTLDPNSDDYASLQFIKRNLLRIPYALRDATKNSTDYKNLKIVYDQLINSLNQLNNQKADKITQQENQKQRILENRKNFNTHSVIDKIREKYTKIDYPENLPLDKLKKFCEQLELKKSGTKEELINRIELKLKLIDPVLTQTTFLTKSYKGKNSWTLPELENMAEELDIELFEDSTREEIYHLINDYYLDQEKKLYSVSGETNVYSPDRIIDDSQDRKLQIHGKNFQGNNFTVTFKASKKAINDWIKDNKLTIKSLSEVSTKRTFDESESESESNSIDTELEEAISMLKKQKL